MTVRLDRLLRALRHLSLREGLLAGASRLISRLAITRIDRVILLLLSRRVGAVGDRAAMIACSATAAMYVERADRSIIVTRRFRLENVDVGRTIVVDFTVLIRGLIRLL